MVILRLQLQSLLGFTGRDLLGEAGTVNSSTTLASCHDDVHTVDGMMHYTTRRRRLLWSIYTSSYLVITNVAVHSVNYHSKHSNTVIHVTSDVRKRKTIHMRQ